MPQTTIKFCKVSVCLEERDFLRASLKTVSEQAPTQHIFSS